MTNFDEIVRSSSINALLKEGVKTVQKKKGKEYPKHTSKKGKNNSNVFRERRERQNFDVRRLSTGRRRRRRRREQPLLFLSFAVESPSKLLPRLAREGRDAKTGRRRSVSSSSFLRAGRGRGEGIDFFELSKVL